MIKKRHMLLNEKFLEENPNFCHFKGASQDVRQSIIVKELPRMGREAALKAIKEWGRPLSAITHLIFCTTGSPDMPGSDYQLALLLGLSPSVKRFMLGFQACAAGGTVLRLAKDLAENTPGARVLVVCSETTVGSFRGPSAADLDCLVSEALFGDGASAAIIGADPNEALNERPLFRLVAASQRFLPGSERDIKIDLSEAGLTVHLSKRVPGLISDNVERVLEEALSPLGIAIDAVDWNSLFWVCHPGGRAILDQLEDKLMLKKEKFGVSRHVLAEYGNLVSPCVFFIMDEMRKRSVGEGKSTTGEGLDMGILFGFGPGLTIETVVLQSAPTPALHCH